MGVSETVQLDRAVVRRILRGDEAAFRAVFERCFPRLYRYALARLEGDADAAEEVVQQTFCKGLEHLDAYRGEAALYTWFHRICRNTLLDYCRARGRALRALPPFEEHPAISAVLEAIAAPAVDRPEVEAWQRDLSRLVQATIDALPERYGVVLEWKYVEELPVREIAARLDLGVKAAESLLARARSAFKDAFTALAQVPDALEPPFQTG